MQKKATIHKARRVPTRSSTLKGSRSNGKSGIRFSVGKAFGREMTFSELGGLLHIPVREVLSRICQPKGPNVEAFELLYAEFRKDPRYKHLKHFSQIKGKVYQYWAQAWGQHAHSDPLNAPYRHWKIPKEAVLTLPIAATRVPLSKSTEFNASRFSNHRAIKIDLGGVLTIANEISELAQSMRNLRERLENRYRKELNDSFGCAVVASGVARIYHEWHRSLVREGKLPIQSKRFQLAKDLDRQFAAFHSVASEVFSSPLSFLKARDKEDFDRLSRQALALLTDKKRCEVIEDAIKNSYKHSYHYDAWESLFESLIQLVNEAAQAPDGASFVDKHLEPVLYQLADGVVWNQSELAKLHPKARKLALGAWKKDFSPWSAKPNSASLLQIALSTYSSATPLLVGNIEGPSSLAIAIAKVFSSRIHVYSGYLAGGNSGGLRFGFAFAMASVLKKGFKHLGVNEVDVVDLMFQQPPEVVAKQLKQGELGMLRGPTLNSAVAIACLVSIYFLCVADSSAKSRTRYVLDLTAAFSNFGSSVIATVQSFAQSTGARNIVMSEALFARLAAIAVVAVAAITVYEKWEILRNDPESLNLGDMGELLVDVGSAGLATQWLMSEAMAASAGAAAQAEGAVVSTALARAASRPLLTVAVESIVEIGTCTGLTVALGGVVLVGIVTIQVHSYLESRPQVKKFLELCLEKFRSSPAGKRALESKAGARLLRELESCEDWLKQDGDALEASTELTGVPSGWHYWLDSKHTKEHRSWAIHHLEPGVVSYLFGGLPEKYASERADFSTSQKKKGS